MKPNTLLNTKQICCFFLCFFLFAALSAQANIILAEGIVKERVSYSTLISDEISEFSGDGCIILNNNIPDFYLSELTAKPFVYFSEFDELGRTGAAFACLGIETFPSVPRGIIGNIQPSGWHTIRYDDLIEDRYLYNRSHVIGYQLSGDNSTPENLFTGTRYLNATSMVNYESKVAQYIESSQNHVLYRVSPCYRDDDLVPFGVQMEAYSIEDHGQGICFNVFLYNIQPGIIIDYRTGDSERGVNVGTDSFSFAPDPEENDPGEIDRFSDESMTVVGDESSTEAEVTYVFNKNSRKFHLPDCHSVIDMKPKNREFFYGTREDAIALGYEPCGSCKP